MNATIALLLTAGLGEEYWQEAFGCAVHVYNSMSCAHPQKYPKSPLKTFMEFKPIIGHFQPWGVLAFALRKKSKKDLLEKAGFVYIWVTRTDTKSDIAYLLYRPMSL